MAEIIDFASYKKTSPSLDSNPLHEKAIILSISMVEYLDELLVVEENKLIRYFTKIAKRKRTLENLHFFSFRYYWSSKLLRYPLEDIMNAIVDYGQKHKHEKDLIFNLGLLFNLHLFFFNNVETNIKLSIPTYVDTGLKYFEKIKEFNTLIT